MLPWEFLRNLFRIDILQNNCVGHEMDEIPFVRFSPVTSEVNIMCVLSQFGETPTAETEVRIVIWCEQYQLHKFLAGSYMLST